MLGMVGGGCSMVHGLLNSYWCREGSGGTVSSRYCTCTGSMVGLG